MVLIGAIGALVAAPTPDVSNAVLTAGGLTWTVVSLAMLGLAIADVARRRHVASTA